MYLGLDLGTSSVKALLIDGDQAAVASATGDLDVSRSRPGWSEQEPADWVNAAEEAVMALKGSHPRELAAVKGIGLSGQMHGATLLGAGDEVLRPCILWNDTRSFKEAAALDADPRFRAITGNIVFPGFTAPKLAWVKANVHPLDPVFRLAEDHGVVLLNGNGFAAPDWSVRVSFANLPDHVYDDIGRAVRSISRGYREAYEATLNVQAPPMAPVPPTV